MAELVVKVTDSGISTTEGKLKRFSDTGKQAEKSQKYLEKQNARTADSLVKLVKNVAGAISAYETFKSVALTAIKTQANFEQSIADLSAITGAAGDELAYLAKQAKELGSTTQFSASQAAEAFKLIASAKPDLLENSAALSQVTKQTLLLAEAAGVELTEAAITVGTSLNQFGAEADQAARFVNVLAAGSKLGASEIEQTSEALKNAGVAASNAGVSFEEANAVIQMFAANGIKGAEAGTALRNIILKLDTSVDENLRPSVVGLNKALVGLNDLQLTAEQRVKMFGLENNVAATLVASNADEIALLTESLTGTDTAAEQASIRSDTLRGDFGELGSAADGLAITLGNSTNESLRFTIKRLTEAAKKADHFYESLSKGTEANLTIKITKLNKQIKNLEKDIENNETAMGRLANVFTFTTTDSSILRGELKSLQDELASTRDEYNDLYGAAPTEEFIGPPEPPKKPEKPDSDERVETLAEKLERERLERQEKALKDSIDRQVQSLANQFKSEEQILSERIELIKSSSMEESEQKTLIDQLEDQLQQKREARDSAKQDSINAQVLAMQDSMRNEREILEERLALIEQANAEEIDKARLKHLAIKEFEDKQDRDRQNNLDKEKRSEREKVSLLMQSTGMIASALDERTAAYKLAASAQTMISTYSTAQTVFEDFNELFPGPVGMSMGSAAAGAAVGVGLANLREINSARAQGGQVNSGDRVLVGERGPEVVTFGQGGRVTPNSQLGGMGAQSKPVNVVVNNNAPNTQATATQDENGDVFVRIDQLDELMSGAAANINSEFNQSLNSTYQMSR